MPADDNDAQRARSQPARSSSAGSVSFVAALSAIWGPGLLVMLADTDAGNVVTAAQSGAVWGFRLLPVLVLLIPVLILVQDLAVRIGLFGAKNFGAMIRTRFGLVGGIMAAAALIAATLGSMITELTGIAGVGELYGVPRLIVLPLASLTLILVVLTGRYRQAERIALLFGLFELAFFAVAWRANPLGHEVLHDVADQKFADPGYLYLGAGLIGATFNPWMIFYQASAISKKCLTGAYYNAARWDTISGAILTQSATAAVLIAVAALNRSGISRSLGSVGEISHALTPLLGETIGRAVFGAGVVGASMAAAIVSSLACAWGLGEIFSLHGSVKTTAKTRTFTVWGYTIWIVACAAFVLAVDDLVWLSIAMQVLNALLLPCIVVFLVILAATALPIDARLKGAHLWVTVWAVGIVSVAGVIGALAGLV
jgi:Mn2+/Fe2+ NRAMP family transporter